MAQKTDFSEILKKLRLKRNISQKSAASSLGVSQALLSHYEKGIRECGLNFLIKCTEFYKVSSDYLLGICGDETYEQSNSLGSIQEEEGKKDEEKDIDVGEIEYSGNHIEVIDFCNSEYNCDDAVNDCILKRNGEKSNVHLLLYRNLIKNSIDYIFDMAKIEQDEETITLVEKYFAASVYLLVKENSSELEKDLVNFRNIFTDLKQKNIDFDILSTKFPKKIDVKSQKRLSLINLIKNTDSVFCF